MKSNVLGPALIAKAFLPALEKSGESDRPPIVMNTSSGLGSIGLQCGPKEAIYSISKVALNMLVRDKLTSLRRKALILLFFTDL